MNNKERIAQLESELLAEREKREDAERKLRITGDAYNALDEQLLQAQAAIERHNKSGYGGDYPINIDATALREHDAALVKPLVEALQRLYGLVEQGYLVRDTSHDADPKWYLKEIELTGALRMAQDVLAKEGKYDEQR